MAKKIFYLLIVVFVFGSLGCARTRVPFNKPWVLDGEREALYYSKPDSDSIDEKSVKDANKYICYSENDVSATFRYIRTLEAGRSFGNAMPKITVCILSSEFLALFCSFNGGETFLRPLLSSSGFVCWSDTDHSAIMGYIRRLESQPR